MVIGLLALKYNPFLLFCQCDPEKKHEIPELKCTVERFVAFNKSEIGFNHRGNKESSIECE